MFASMNNGTAGQTEPQRAQCVAGTACPPPSAPWQLDAWPAPEPPKKMMFYPLQII